MRNAALGVLMAVLVLAGCATGERRFLPAPPAELHLAAEIPGFPDVRAWGDVPSVDVEEQIAVILGQLKADAAREGHKLNGGRADVLVLSGGGSDGAYGAGLLTAWSERGTRPEFLLVTGVSTGALIAPFAFLGPDYDDELKALYTGTKREKIFEFAIFDALFGGLAVGDTSPAEAILARLVDDEMVAAIAREYRRGRRLWIGTTYLDAERPMVWDIGAIAASGNPGAARLIRQIMLASAAIPGIFPPVFIDVEAGGRLWGEMHVDGGVTNQLFFLPFTLRLPRETGAEKAYMRRDTIYAVRNTRLEPDYAPVEARVWPIVRRSVSTLIKASGINDLRLLAVQADRENFRLEVTSVPASFDMEEAEPFDQAYMSALFELGRDRMLGGEAWQVVVERGR